MWQRFGLTYPGRGHRIPLTKKSVYSLHSIARSALRLSVGRFGGGGRRNADGPGEGWVALFPSLSRTFTQLSKLRQRRARTLARLRPGVTERFCPFREFFRNELVSP